MYYPKTCLSPLNYFCPSSGEIPDAAFIHAARKRRQLARELGGDAPLVETEATNKHLAEDEQDASDDEDEKRIRFSGVKNKTQRQKIAEEIGIVVKKKKGGGGGLWYRKHYFPGKATCCTPLYRN